MAHVTWLVPRPPQVTVRKGAMYKSGYLAQGSDAHRLLVEGKFKELDQHLKSLKEDWQR